MDTCISLFQKEQEDRAYRFYVTECLRHILENTAKTAKMASEMLGKDVEAKYINVSFEEMLHPKPAETRTSEEIISHIKEKLQDLGGE